MTTQGGRVAGGGGGVQLCACGWDGEEDIIFSPGGLRFLLFHSLSPCTA